MHNRQVQPRQRWQRLDGTLHTVSSSVLAWCGSDRALILRSRPPAGSFKLDLVSGTTLDDPLAKCLSSMWITVAGSTGSCTVAVTPLAAADNFVQGLWGAAGTYTTLIECPATAGAPVTAAGDDAGVAAAILVAINSAIYGTPVAGAGVTAVDFSNNGTAVLNRTSAVSLEFAITSVSGGHGSSCGLKSLAPQPAPAVQPAYPSPTPTPPP